MYVANQNCIFSTTYGPHDVIEEPSLSTGTGVSPEHFHGATIKINKNWGPCDSTGDMAFALHVANPLLPRWSPKLPEVISGGRSRSNPGLPLDVVNKMIKI